MGKGHQPLVILCARHQTHAISFVSAIHSSFTHAPDTVLGPGDLAMNKEASVSSHRAEVLVGETTMNRDKQADT